MLIVSWPEPRVAVFGALKNGFLPNRRKSGNPSPKLDAKSAVARWRDAFGDLRKEKIGLAGCVDAGSGTNSGEWIFRLD